MSDKSDEKRHEAMSAMGEGKLLNPYAADG